MTSWMSRHQGAWARLGGVVLAVIVAVSLSGCGLTDWVSDRFQTCHDTTVRLVNSEQTLGDVHIVVEGENASEENRLASGASREVVECLERGRGYRHRAELDGRLLAVVTCPAAERRYEAQTPTVVWTPVGFRCVDW